MKIIKRVVDIRKETETLRKDGKIVGLVSTMGYFHDGHLSLMRRAKKECGKTVVSIFVNPAQFGPGEDLKKYPRNFRRDCKLAEKEGVDYIFSPSAEEMYKPGYGTFVEVETLSKIMCGRARPGHFRGVCTVVLKLFNIVNPHRAYFGEKDYQQLVIIKKMVKDLNLNLEIKGCPIIREKDGLALSSRNKYLSGEERENAAILNKCLETAREMIGGGERNLEKVKGCILERLRKNRFIKKVDYFDFRNTATLEEIKKIKKEQDKILAATAAWVGNTRLIDNKIIKV